MKVGKRFVGRKEGRKEGKRGVDIGRLLRVLYLELQSEVATRNN